MQVRSATTMTVLCAFQTTTRVIGRQRNSFAIRTFGRSNFFARSMSSTTESSPNKYFTVGLTGSGGFIGTAFRNEISRVGTVDGKPIRCVSLKRGSQAEQKSLEDMASASLVWNPKGSNAQDILSPAALKEMDAIVHLSGENISTGLSGPLAPLGIRPWTDAKKKEIIDSRVVTTRALAKSIAASGKKMSFIVAGGVGAYGSHFMEGAEAADESTDVSNTEGFMAEVSRKWEESAKEAEESDARVVKMRNGVVLSKKDGVLAKLYPAFFLGGGGIVGSGKQYFPFISARDMARAMVHVLKTSSLEGPVNMCAPGGCTNAEFTKAMGTVLRRPTIFPLPSFAVSLMFGEMGDELLLGGTRANPTKLLDSGFEFYHPTIELAVQSAVDEEI
eukprot:scaffold15259_cov122-Cylindrotheca_fusiformis.AAC.6